MATKVTQEYVEVLSSSGDAGSRVTQEFVEVLSDATTPGSTRVTQEFAEALSTIDDVGTRVTQQYVEVLSGTVIIVPPDLSPYNIEDEIGCGIWTAYVAERWRDGHATSAKRWELPWTSLSAERVLDSTSRASASIPCIVEGLPGPLRWGYELHLYRNNELSWLGPITGTVHTRDGIRIDAQDLMAWTDRRLLENPFDITDDLSVIFGYVIDQAMLRDPVGIQVAPMLSGVIGRRTNDETGTRRAGDLLREIARTAVDYTMVGRTLLVGGTIPGQTQSVRLVDEAFNFVSLTSDGTSSASEVVMVGANASLVARSGGLDDFGLVQITETESTIADTNSLQAAADSRVDLLSGDLIRLSGSLSRKAAVTVSQLIPGHIFHAHLSLVGRDVDEDMRLLSVRFDIGEDEKVTVDLIPVGA